MGKSSDIRDYRGDVIIKLIDLNQGIDNYAKCNRIKCINVHCSTCPMKGAWSGKGAVNTLGELRKLDPREKPVEQKGCAIKGPEAIEGVREPSHYQVFDGLESIEVIARSMTVEQFRGFCMGNTLKYRLRAGKKSDQANVTKDLAKSEFYKELFEKHKGECHVA